MRKTYLLLAFAAFMFSCSGNNSFNLTGKFDKCNNQMLYLICSGEVLDSINSTDGSFEFNGTAAIPALAYVTNNRVVRSAVLQCMFILEPGKMVMEPIPESPDYVVRGTKANDLLAGLAEESMKLTQYYEKNEGKDGIIEEVEAKYNNILLKGVKENFDNMYGLACLRELAYEQDPADTRQMLDSFIPDLKKTKLWESLDANNQKHMATATGQPYIDFSQAKPDGSMLSAKEVISNPANKYVLLDFWASWCGPCMREVPYLKKTYSKYSDKGFQILGVSLDQKRESWLKAIDDNDMSWLHVSDLKYWSNEAAGLYGVNSIPANFLIDCSTGKIIATSLRGDKLEQKIAELLK